VVVACNAHKILNGGRKEGRKDGRLARERGEFRAFGMTNKLS
jgi:hypothetical protein